MLAHTIRARAGEVRRMYDAICVANPDFKEFPFQEFKDHCISGFSRNFNLKIDGEWTTGMVPFADMHNHTVPSDAGSVWTYHQPS